MKKRIVKKVKGLLLIMMVMWSTVQGVYAASEDIIDRNRRGSITIYKYDVTAAEEDGVQISKGMFKENGEEDKKAKEILNNYTIPGVEFTYLKVGDIHTDSQNGRIEVLYDIPDTLETILKIKSTRNNHKYTSDELNEALSNVLVSNTEGKNLLEKYVKDCHGSQMDLTDQNGMTTENNLGLGLYLIVETKVPANVDTTVNPFFVTLPMTDGSGERWFYDTEIYPKNQTSIADLDKLVKEADKKDAEYTDTATGSEGDIMEYIFVSHLPRISSEATYLTKYEFTDTMGCGLSYNKDLSIRFYNNEEDARTNNKGEAVKTWETGGKQFKVSYTENEDGMQQMKVSPSIEGLEEINPAYSEHWMVVSYSCTINSDSTPILGDEGNKNSVNLEWKRSSDMSVDTLEDFTRVYTFGLNIQKKFSDTDGKAEDVRFILKNEVDGYWVTAEFREEFPGVYYITDRNKGNSQKEATVFSPSKEGKLIIHGLEADTYILTEIATSKGYSLLKESITIQITGTVDEIQASKSSKYDQQLTGSSVIEVHGDRASALVDQKNTDMINFSNEKITSNHAFVDMTILNTKTFTLPQTGGIGTFLFTLAGCCAALAGVILITKKSENFKKEV